MSPSPRSSRRRWASTGETAIGAEAALDAALRALRHLDRTRGQLDAHLRSRGFEDAERLAALATLERTGLLDDRRYAEGRARLLSERGAGNALIRHDLAAADVPADLADEAVAALALERDRAARIVERRGASARTARYLAGKGFSEDSVRAAIAPALDDPLG